MGNAPKDIHPRVKHGEQDHWEYDNSDDDRLVSENGKVTTNHPEQENYSQNNRWIFAQYAEQERMLADKPRMAFYQEMVKRHIKPGDQVIDLGTGTGILAAFASWQGASKIHAIDHSVIIEEARVLAAFNKIKNVEFHAIHSSKFMVEKRVDVILHEQMGDVLFDEEMVTNVLDLRDRLLKRKGKILPARFELYCEPVQLRDDRAVPFIWELNVGGFDFSPLKDRRHQNSGYYSFSETDQSLVDHFLCEPIPLLTFDLHTLKESELPIEITVAAKVVQGGRMDGYAVYFRALVDDDLALSTSPLDRGRAPHWGYRILRTHQFQVEQGDVLDITVGADRWSELDTWQWDQVLYTAEQYRDCMSDGDEEEENDDEWTDPV